MKRLVCCIITSAIILISSLTNATTVKAVSNEIGTFKETVFVNVLRDSNNQNNIIDSQSGNWGRITSNYKYGLRINLRRTGENNAFPFQEGDIIDISYVLVNSSYITAGGNAPSQPTCLNSSWIFTVVDCTIHMQNVSDVEYLTSMYSVDLTMLRDPVTDSSTLGGLISQWSAGQPQSYSNNINIYYFQYRLRYTGQGESRDNIILYGNFTNGQPWWLQFNETIPISSSLEQGAMQANEQQKQEGQQAQQDGQTGGNTSQETVNQGSQTMLQGAQTILGVITDTPAGTCNISGNMGNIDLGQLNLCEGNIEPLRPIIRIIVNLVMGVATWKIFTFLLGTMVQLFLSFTGGRKVDGE